ncbi:MAG: hypothetical protein JWM64_1749 [Frankiales bacterium]|nr:hypothetical protein [Frankiales bacterium]
MRLFGRGRTGGSRSGSREERGAAQEHLEAFAGSRRGVEGFVEPETPTTPSTLVLVAADGEWTRRRTTPAEARALGARLGLPVYDVAAVGYPARMREWTSARRAAGENGPDRP